MSQLLIDYSKAEIARAEKIVFTSADFTVGPGEFLYLLGKVGSGKSSLLKTIYAEVPIEKAERAMVMGNDMLTLRRNRIPYLRRKMGIIFQDFQLLQNLSAADNLDFVLRATGWKSKKERLDRIDEVLTEVGLSYAGYKMPHQLSGGEQQRVAIARALLNHPELILADEPTGNLDPNSGMQIARLLHSLPEKGQTVIMATHNLALVERFPARAFVCRDKRLIATSLKAPGKTSD